MSVNGAENRSPGMGSVCGRSPLTAASVVLGAIGVFLLVVNGQPVLGCGAAALLTLFGTARNRR